MAAPSFPLRLLTCLLDADAYAQTIAPVLAPLSTDFAAYVGPQPGDSVLDAGTGTGALAGLLAARADRVTGLDASWAALRIARAQHVGAAWAVGDVHAPPFAPGTFSLVVSSFGLNMTVPWRSLPALRRLLAPAGRLVVQEWGPQDALSGDLEVLLDAHLPHALPAPLAAYYDWLADDPPLWIRYLQDAEDYRDWLSDMGLVVEVASESAPVALTVPSADAYLSWWLAWPVRRQTAAALPAEESAALRAAARARIAQEASADGAIVWRPRVLRARAHA